MPASRPDLDQERRQQLLDRFLRDYERDRQDGKTTRALHETMKAHAAEDKLAFAKLSEEVEAARLDVARHEGMMVKVTDTGRFILPPTQINIEAPKNSRRPSTPPFLQKIFEKPAVVVLIALASVFAHAILKLLK
jgi:hypothetical protein